MDKDPEYKAFLLAKARAEEDVKTRAQAAAIAEAIKGPLEKLAANMAAAVSASSNHPKQKEVEVPKEPPSSKKAEPVDDDTISVEKAAYIEAIFGFAFKLSLDLTGTK